MGKGSKAGKGQKREKLIVNVKTGNLERKTGRPPKGPHVCIHTPKFQFGDGHLANQDRPIVKFLFPKLGDDD